jgi:hypothetical protein
MGTGIVETELGVDAPNPPLPVVADPTPPVPPVVPTAETPSARSDPPPENDRLLRLRTTIAMVRAVMVLGVTAPVTVTVLPWTANNGMTPAARVTTPS